MDLTSTSSLILFPTALAQKSQNIEQFHELARQAAMPLPAQRQVPCQLPSAKMASMQASVQARRRQEKEELKRVHITSFRSKDGLLSPPPLPVYVRRKRKSIVGLNPRAMESSPELGSPSSSEFTESPESSGPPTPPISPYFSRSFAATATDLRISTTHYETAGLGISGPRSAPVSKKCSNASPRRPSPFRSHTMNDALLGTGLIQPPSPSLLRPKSFWKNHPRSALTAVAWSPCSHVVRRSTFVAAGMNIDQGYWDGQYEADRLDLPPRPPKKHDDSTDDDESDTEEAKHHAALRAFGNSLSNASTLALAVESRTKGVGMPVVCVPGEF